MIWKVSAYWLTLGAIVTCMLAYLMGYAIDKVIGREAYGPAGNMFFLVAGFFGSIYAANKYGLAFYKLQNAIAIGLGGACVLLLVAILVKAIMYRLSG